jgi:uncharacterized protein YbaA (DUF1428 family)
MVHSRWVDASPTTYRLVRSTSLPRSVTSRRAKTAIFSWIVLESREHRGRVNAEVMKDRALEAPEPDAAGGPHACGARAVTGYSFDPPVVGWTVVGAPVVGCTVV